MRRSYKRISQDPVLSEISSSPAAFSHMTRLRPILPEHRTSSLSQFRSEICKSAYLLKCHHLFQLNSMWHVCSNQFSIYDIYLSQI